MTDIIGRLRAAAPCAFANLPVRFAYLYGSQATGQANAASDIDVAVVLEKGAPDQLSVALRCAEELARHSRLPGIEVIALDEAPLRFVGRVLRHRLVLYSHDEPGRVTYESLRSRMADDVEVWGAAMDRDLLVAIARGKR